MYAAKHPHWGVGGKPDILDSVLCNWIEFLYYSYQCIWLEIHFPLSHIQGWLFTKWITPVAKKNGGEWLIDYMANGTLIIVTAAAAKSLQ